MKGHFKKFVSYYKPYYRLFFTDMLCALVVAGITLTLPLLTRVITKEILNSGLSDAMVQIYQVGLVMLGLIAIHTVCNYFIGYQGHVMGAKMESDMRDELFAKYQKLSFRFYDEKRTGDLMSRLSNDLLSLTELYHHGPEDLLIYSIRFIGSFLILWNINQPLTLLVFAFLPILAVYVWFFNRRVYRAMKENRVHIAEVNAQAEDNLSGIRVVKSFANEAEEQAKFSRANNQFLSSRSAIYKSESQACEGAFAITQIISVVVIVFGGAFIIGQKLDLADLLTFTLYIGFFIEPIQKLPHMMNQYQEGFTAFERFMEIIEVEAEEAEEKNQEAEQVVQGAVTFDEVSFRYREDSEDVLSHISFEAKVGQTIALVGASGVGKTTVCSLIPRFYDATSGVITIDGKEIHTFTLSSLRRAIGVVQQDVYLFAGTVIENIQYGKPDATKEEIIAAAKHANAHDFIMALPNGYDTDIGQRGVKLSGGQKQRLSIARVFLKNPPILILDEATSALDTESERMIQQSLEQLSKHRTTFVIAHRLSTIRHADKILVFSDGEIIEQGTHEELIKQDGLYAKM